jgi:hypothetical protein
MSAPSPMCRARFLLVLAVAVVMSAVTHAAPDTSAAAQGKAVHSRSTHSRVTPHTRRHTSRRLETRAPQRESVRTSTHSLAHRTARETTDVHRRSPHRPAREVDARSRRNGSSRRLRQAELRRSRRRENAGIENAGRKPRLVHASAGRVLPRRSGAVDAAPAESSAASPEAAPGVSRRFTRQVSLRIARGGMPPPLRGSLELLERQDQRLQADGLQRIEDEQDLSERIAHHLLVPIPAVAALAVNPQLLPSHRYCRPWTAQFLTDIAGAYAAAFHTSLELTSAVRPVSYQERLVRINGNAAPAEGDIVSPHVMGATIDIGKKGLSWREIAWMRRRLLALEDAGKIDVEEEFHQSCFHITVYRSYLPASRSLHATEAAEDATRPGAAPVSPMPASLGAGSTPGGQ